MLSLHEYKSVWAALIIFLPSIIGILGCGQDKASLIRQIADEKVQTFRQSETAICRQRLLEDAERTVDSILLEEARAEILDSLNRARPLRPAPPAPLDPIDSAEVRPIFNSGL
jgi:hypothetical protein